MQHQILAFLAVALLCQTHLIQFGQDSVSIFDDMTGLSVALDQILTCTGILICLSGLNMSDMHNEFRVGL